MNRSSVLAGAVLPVLCFCFASSRDLGPVWQSGPPLPYDELWFVPVVFLPFLWVVLATAVANLIERFRFVLLAGCFVSIHYLGAFNSALDLGPGLFPLVAIPVMLGFLLLRWGQPLDLGFLLLIPLGLLSPFLIVVVFLCAPALALVAWIDTLRRLGWPSWSDWCAAAATYAFAWHSAIGRAQEYYATLPTDPPEGCFIVTAAARGGSKRQLIVFKAFEFQLQGWCPALHAILRRVYNRVGPIIANTITTPRRAALVRALLKPAEWFLTAQLLTCLPSIWFRCSHLPHLAFSLPVTVRPTGAPGVRFPRV